MPVIPTVNTSDMGDPWAQRAPADDVIHDPDRFYDVRIRTPGATGIDAWIELDGVPLRGVRAYSVKVGLDDVNEVTVTFIAGSVNRDAEPTSPA